MNDLFERLSNDLLKVNDSLSYAQARTWVEVLWEDFETTRAKAGYDYKGKAMTEQIVKQWIKNYGPRLHEFVTNNPKYEHLLNHKNHLMH
ncbi:YfhJ family protein [Bacillus sp. Marseille-P3661]|uniref:YfhJ family protein n=1 Tax=Bacillus sp. Marseille-P3661 TaxID=1936234 RepID=UPI000C85828D|nr:YfhJ family protein [Bacillus sp. Marseille-P3661]